MMRRRLVDLMATGWMAMLLTGMPGFVGSQPTLAQDGEVRYTIENIGVIKPTPVKT